MPLLPGKKNIGHNVEEMEKSGHPHKQAVAAALHTALDDDGEEGTLNSKLMKSAQRQGAIMSHDAPEMHSTTAMTQADVNKHNERYWGGENGNLGPAESEAKAPLLAGTKVYNPYGHDEVAPTQSSPPDTRSDNLLERAHGGLDASGVTVHQVGRAARVGFEAGHALAEGFSDDDPKFVRPFAEPSRVLSKKDIPKERLAPKKAKDDLTEGAESRPVAEDASSSNITREVNHVKGTTSAKADFRKGTGPQFMSRKIKQLDPFTNARRQGEVRSGK